MARVSLDPPRTLFFRAMEWYSRRAYGEVLDPGKAMAHSPRVLWGYLRFERSVSRWNKLDHGLGALAELAAAGAIGCSWCMDFGYWVSHRAGVDPEKLRSVPGWRDSDVYTPLERDVLEYAEAMSLTPPTVPDELAERLRDRLGEPAFVELTALIAVENQRSRMNSALGLTSQGFKDQCDLRDRPPSSVPTSQASAG
ncbi:carboxymuconolactone decarboxylase family protein [Streptomyces odontomachi]|uniref:carboxymuconolactone decarboxylase family protein n=1 Tax=Streptomyces odontomachi TaxID=2944940 RepID=UPI002109E1CE|nr:carboxymuconolactone decarboxylase family protein [Streptomyces sp. ODS25]